MQGTVLQYDKKTHTGLINGHDGTRYSFVFLEWKSPISPKEGLLVDFETSEKIAINIIAPNAKKSRNRKREFIALGCAFLWSAGKTIANSQTENGAYLFSYFLGSLCISFIAIYFLLFILSKIRGLNPKIQKTFFVIFSLLAIATMIGFIRCPNATETYRKNGLSGLIFQQCTGTETSSSEQTDDPQTDTEVVQNESPVCSSDTSKAAVKEVFEESPQVVSNNLKFLALENIQPLTQLDKEGTTNCRASLVTNGGRTNIVFTFKKQENEDGYWIEFKEINDEQWQYLTTLNQLAPLLNALEKAQNEPSAADTVPVVKKGYQFTEQDLKDAAAMEAKEKELGEYLDKEIVPKLKAYQEDRVRLEQCTKFKQKYPDAQIDDQDLIFVSTLYDKNIAKLRKQSECKGSISDDFVDLKQDTEEQFDESIDAEVLKAAFFSAGETDPEQWKKVDENCSKFTKSALNAAQANWNKNVFHPEVCEFQER